MVHLNLGRVSSLSRALFQVFEWQMGRDPQMALKTPCRVTSPCYPWWCLLPGRAQCLRQSKLVQRENHLWLQDLCRRPVVITKDEEQPAGSDFCAFELMLVREVPLFPLPTHLFPFIHRVCDVQTWMSKLLA